MDVSVIIVNWNTKDLLRNCLNSVRLTIADLSYEIILVDNASRDGSVAMVREEFPGVIIIENVINRGFGAPNNQALAIMRGKYALLVNTDTVLAEGAVRELFSFMQDHPDAGMACGQLLNEDGSKQNSIANYPTLLTLLLNKSLLEYLFPKRYPSKRYHHKGPIPVDSGIGACLMVSREAIDIVGGFDERYFFFFEETDLALQMRSAGWKIYHVPSAFIYHLQGRSIGNNAGARIEFYRSRYKFFRKWKSPPYYALTMVVLFSRLIVNWFLVSIANVFSVGMIKGMRNKWIVYSQLIAWHLRGCP
jgi:GT2 family glycosyltransferase